MTASATLLVAATCSDAGSCFAQLKRSKHQELTTSHPSVHDKTCRQCGDSMPTLPFNRCPQIDIQRLSDNNSPTKKTDETYVSFCWQSDSGCAFSWEEKEMMAGATNTRPAMSYRQSQCYGNLVWEQVA